MDNRQKLFEMMKKLNKDFLFEFTTQDKLQVSIAQSPEFLNNVLTELSTGFKNIKDFKSHQIGSVDNFSYQADFNYAFKGNLIPMHVLIEGNAEVKRDAEGNIIDSKIEGEFGLYVNNAIGIENPLKLDGSMVTKETEQKVIDKLVDLDTLNMEDDNGHSAYDEGDR